MKTFMRIGTYLWFFYFVIAFRLCTYWLLCTFTEFSKHGYKLILGETLYLSQHVLSLSQGVLSLSLYIYQARIQAVRGEKHFLQRQLVEPQSLASLRELLLWRDWKDGCSLWRGTCSSRRRWGRSTPWWWWSLSWGQWWWLVTILKILRRRWILKRCFSSRVQVPVQLWPRDGRTWHCEFWFNQGQCSLDLWECGFGIIKMNMYPLICAIWIWIAGVLRGGELELKRPHLLGEAWRPTAWTSWTGNIGLY